MLREPALSTKFGLSPVLFSGSLNRIIGQPLELLSEVIDKNKQKKTFMYIGQKCAFEYNTIKPTM